MSKRNRQPINELSNDPYQPPPVPPPGVVMHLEPAEFNPCPTTGALWRISPVRLQLVRAIQVKGDQFVGVQGVSEFWLYPKAEPDTGHGYVLADDARGLLLQLERDGKPTQRVFVGWGNIAGISERTPK